MALKLNPLTGKFDLVNPDNFSHTLIPTNVTKIIPANQQMIVNQNIQIDGTLLVDGELVLI